MHHAYIHIHTLPLYVRTHTFTNNHPTKNKLCACVHIHIDTHSIQTLTHHTIKSAHEKQENYKKKEVRETSGNDQKEKKTTTHRKIPAITSLQKNKLPPTGEPLCHREKYHLCFATKKSLKKNTVLVHVTKTWCFLRGKKNSKNKITTLSCYTSQKTGTRWCLAPNLPSAVCNFFLIH